MKVVAETSQHRLAAGLGALAISLDAQQQNALLDYIALIERWNRVHNLTAVRDIDQMVTLHLLDALAVHPHVVGRNVMDIGAGAGVPGIPLAIAGPQRQVTLVESSQKKAAFLRHAVHALRLANVEIMCARAETVRTTATPDVLIARAFSSLETFVRITRDIAGPDTRWYAMKGEYPHDEISALPPDIRIERTQELAVPGLRAERHLIILSKSPR